MTGIPIVLPSVSPTGSGTTLVRYRRRLAEELGWIQVVNTTATPSQGEATRVLIASEVRDDESGYDYLGDPWVYVRTGAQAGVQRRVIRTPEVGYIGQMGVLQVSRPFAAAVASGSTIEITSPLPCKGHLGVRGLNDLVNEALALIWIEVRVSITGNGTREYDLAGYPWLWRYEQMRGLYDTVWLAAGEPNELSPYGARLVSNGVDRTLVTETTYTTSETFEVSALVRANRLVYDGSAWAYTSNETPGLLGDTYEAAVPEEWVLAFGMFKALEFLTRHVTMSKSLSDAEKQAALSDIVPRRRRWYRSAVRIKLYEFPKPLPEPTTALICPPSDPVWN